MHPDVFAQHGATASEYRGFGIRLEQGERLHTENSYKYAPDEFVCLAEDAGFRCEHYWQDADAYFGLYLLEVP